MTDSIHIFNCGNSVCFSTVIHELSHHGLQDTTTQPPDLFYEVDFKKCNRFSELLKQKHDISPTVFQQQTIHPSNKK